MSIITVRQTRDPYKLCANTKYIAFGKVTLEDNGNLSMKNVGASIGKPNDVFIMPIKLNNKEAFLWLPREGLIPACEVKKYILSETNETVMTIVKREDPLAAEARLHRAEQIAYLKGCFVHAWTWMASHLCPQAETSGGDLSRIQASPQNSQRSLWASILKGCNWRQRKDSGGYEELNEDSDIKEK